METFIITRMAFVSILNRTSFANTAADLLREDNRNQGKC